MNLQYLWDRIQGKAPKGAKRSSRWRQTREHVILVNKKCAVCGSTKKLEVHHVVPFHYAPDKELDLENLVVLCERKKYGINCHLLIGHLGNYRRFNPVCKIDIMTWAMKLGKR